MITENPVSIDMSVSEVRVPTPEEWYLAQLYKEGPWLGQPNCTKPTHLHGAYLRVEKFMENMQRLSLQKRYVTD